MGTRSEIMIRTTYEKKDGTKEIDVIELWKHWDGYPDYMIKLFEKFMKFAEDSAGSQKHRLFYAEDISSLLIVFDYLEKNGYAKPSENDDREHYPDIRPRGWIDDTSYLYLLEIMGEKFSEMKLKVKIYHDVNQELRDAIHKGEEPEPIEERILDWPFNGKLQSGIICN
jgi:hypothetical protein